MTGQLQVFLLNLLSQNSCGRVLLLQEEMYNSLNHGGSSFYHCFLFIFVFIICVTGKQAFQGFM